MIIGEKIYMAKRKNVLLYSAKRIGIILGIDFIGVFLICFAVGILNLTSYTKGLLYSSAVMVVIAFWAFTSGGGEVNISRAYGRYAATAGFKGKEDKDLAKAMLGEAESHNGSGLIMLICAAITALIGII